MIDRLRKNAKLSDNGSIAKPNYLALLVVKVDSAVKTADSLNITNISVVMLAVFLLEFINVYAF